MDAENPFQSPIAAPVDAGLSVDELRSVMRRWERLRIVYNLLVGLVGIAVLLMMPTQILAANLIKILPGVVMYGLAANVCYFLGPAGEWYLIFLGFRWR